MPKNSPAPPGEEIQEIDRYSAEDIQAMLDKIAQLESVKEPEVVHEVEAFMERPKPIRFQIRPVEQDDAEYMGNKIPGKSFTGGYKLIDVLAIDEYGNHVTGFEVDSLEYQTGLKGQDLTDYQNEVKMVRQWVEKQTNQGLGANNKPFWGGKMLKMENFDAYYDTSNIENLITYYNILGGGYTEVGTSLDDAKKYSKQVYLTVAADESRRNFSYRKATIKANSLLETIMEEWKQSDILYLLYYLPVVKKHGHTLNTPKETIIDEISQFIEGVDTQTEKKLRPQMFIDAVTRMKSTAFSESVKVEGLFNAAIYYGFVTLDRQRKVYETRVRGIVYGTTIKSGVDYLMDAKNVEDFAWLKVKVNDKWIN